MMNDMKNFASVVDDYMLRTIIGKTANIWDAARHYIHGGGKRIRPYLLLKGFELVSGSSEESSLIVPIASSIESVHTFTLIHDDVIDGDEMRRGKQSVHLKWDIPTAILSGDLLFALSMTMVNNSSFKSEIKNMVSSEISKVIVELCEGQMLDVEFENRDNVSPDEYLKMIYLKTAALFRTSVVCGGIAAGATEIETGSLARYGENLGLAFQIVDDILGICGETGKLGKTVGSDIKRGKKTFILLSAFEMLKGAKAEELNKLMASPEKPNHIIERITDIIVESGAVKKAEKLSEGYINSALDSLKSFNDSEAKKRLIEIAEFTLKREV